MSPLEQIFINNLSVQHGDATPMHHRRDGARFPSDLMLSIQAEEFNLGFIRPENLVSHGLRVLYVPFGKLQAGCRVAFIEEWLQFRNYIIKA